MQKKVEICIKTTGFNKLKSNSKEHGGIISVNDLIDTDSDGYKNFDSNTPIDGTLTLTIIAPNSASIDLGEITITIDVAQPNIMAISSDETLGQAQGAYAEYGDEVTISADFTGNADADFLGWKTSLEAEDFVSYSLDYPFTFTEESPTIYYAIFTEPNEYLTYTNNTPTSGEAQLRSSNAGAVDIIVPSAICRASSSYIVTTMYNVSSSSSGVFYQTRSTLQSVSLPDTITNIGSYAFYNCFSLTSVDFGENSQLTSIGDHAFSWCSNLTSITIPNSVTSIGQGAFDGCSRLETVTINEYVYTSVTSGYVCGSILQYANTVYVLQAVVEDTSITMGSYLASNFTQGELADGYYVFTRNA